MKKQEQYSTERAWGVKDNRAQVEYFEKMAYRLRRTVEQMQKTLDHLQKESHSKDIYIGELERKVEHLERFNKIVLP